MQEPSDVETDDSNGYRGTKAEKYQQAAQNISGLRAKQESTLQGMRSKLHSVRNARTFIKPASERKADLQPVPWPMPPKIMAQESGVKSLENGSKSKEAEKEYLTPQSSFALDEENASRVRRLQSTESNCDGSGAFSRESSVRRESFSSIGTGFSFALVGSSDNGSTESVSKVDIDADEFSRVLTERVRSSRAEVDFANLFAEEDQESRCTDSNDPTRTEPKCSSQVAENSTTPKATRAPFLSNTSSGSESNTVSLKEALEFSPDYKTVGPENGRPYDIERNSAGKTEGQQSRQVHMNSIDTAKEQNKETILRRPMASKRTTFLIPPPTKDGTPSLQNNGHDTALPGKPKVSSSKDELSSNQTSIPVEETTPGKGVIVRAQSQISQVAGIRRAETGRIMSRAEMRAQKLMLFQESPNPKSLNPAGFMNEEEDASTVHPSTFLPESSSDSETEVGEQAKQSAKPHTSAAISPKQNPSGNRTTSKVDDGSFLSPGILSRKKKFGAEEYRVDSFQFSEHEGSSGLLNFFSSGLKKVHFGMGKKSSSHDAKEGDSTIVVPGTIDETVCKICVVCRKNLECDVYVKDTGKKIKVESRKDGRSRHLRATILVRQAPGEPSCYVNIRQSRSDGMKTSLATLWNFYQRLEAGMKEIG